MTAPYSPRWTEAIIVLRVPQITGDSGDARGWDQDAVQTQVAGFIEKRAAPVAARRRAREAGSQ